MADAAPAPQTPLWWLQKLEAELYNRQAAMKTMDAYYRGDHPLPFLTKAHESKYRDEFRKLLEDCRANFMRLVVDVPEERMRVEGFRLSAQTDPVGDQPSWRIWQDNNMDANSQTAFVESMVKGVSYLSVWGDGKKPSIAVEDPTQTIVGYEPGSNYSKRAAAGKIWLDDWTGLLRANVYMPDGIYKYQAPNDNKAERTSQSVYAETTADKPRWVPIPDTRTSPRFMKNTVGVVPIIPLRNRPRLLCEGESELSDVYRIQNQINATLFLRALASYFSAHKQRWMVGGQIMKDEVTGQDKEPFNVAVDTMFHDEDPEVKFGEFSQTDLSGYSDAVKQMVDFIAITSRVPRHYLEQSGQAPSGDAIKSAEAGLVQKVVRKQRDFGEALEEAMGLALRFSGQSEPPADSEIVWADPQTESAAVVTDAVIKQYAGGLIPWEAALEKLGYTQTEIERYSKMRLNDSLLGAINTDQGIADPAPPAPVTVKGPIVRA